MTKSKHMVRKACGVSVVFLDVKIAFMREQAVQDIDCIACCCVDGLAVKRSVLIRDMGVENHTRISPVSCVHISESSTNTAKGKVLSV